MKRNPDFLLRDVAGKLVLVPVGAAAAVFPGMVTVNTTGNLLWELLETEQTLDSLVKAMTDRFDVPQEQAKTDIQEFLNRLLAIKAVIE